MTWFLPRAKGGRRTVLWRAFPVVYRAAVRVWWFAIGLWVLLLAAATRVAGLACTGDCNRDEQVSVDEVVRGVAIALGSQPLTVCPVFDRDGDGAVSIDEIVAAVGALLTGCPVAPTPTPTPTPTSTPTLTGTPVPNRPPQILLPVLWYRGYTGYPVAIPIAVDDPEGAPVQCRAQGLPQGAQWEPGWSLHWTPPATSAGTYTIAFECEDSGQPPAVARAQLFLTIATADACTQPVCDAAVGCTRSLVGLESPCCSSAAGGSVDVPEIPCPAGRRLWISEDLEGEFRPLHDCEQKYVRNNAQLSAEVRFKFRTRCLSLDDRMVLELQMDTAQRQPVAAAKYRVQFYPAGPNIAESRPVAFSIEGPRPFFDMEGAEANVRVTVTDGQRNTVTDALRLRLTFTPTPP